MDLPASTWDMYRIVTTSPNCIELRVPDPLNPLAWTILARAVKFWGQEAWRIECEVRPEQHNRVVFGHYEDAVKALDDLASKYQESGDISVIKQGQMIAGMNAPFSRQWED